MPNPSDSESRQLYMAHLSERLQAMEQGTARLKPLAYRVFARRLHQTLAGCVELRIASRFAASHPPIAEALANRYFAVHGHLPGAAPARRLADDLLERLRQCA